MIIKLSVDKISHTYISTNNKPLNKFEKKNEKFLFDATPIQWTLDIPFDYEVRKGGAQQHQHYMETSLLAFNILDCMQLYLLSSFDHFFFTTSIKRYEYDL